MKYGLAAATVASIHQVLARHSEVESAILYGSRAKGNFKAGSDVDLTLLGDKLNSTVLGRIDEELDDLLLPYEFDLSIFNRITHSDLLDHIRRVGVPFYKRPPKSAGPALLLQQFESLADTAGAVAKLRSLILDLAIRGALVPQNPDDPPASNLVELARSQTKEQSKPQRAPNGNGSTQQPPFALPHGWCWTCLDDLGDTAPRNELPDKTEVGFSPMRLVTAKFGAPISFERRPWAEVRKGFTHFADGDVVLAKITPCFENGKSGVIRAAPNGFGAGTTELHVFRPVPKCVIPEYVLTFLKSPHFLLNGEAHMTGSAGQKRVPWTYFAKTAFPLPPLPEQSRIVAKVEELLALCDELEATQVATQYCRTRLVHSALDHLTSAKDETDFRKQCSFILHNSSLILDSVPSLRQAILALAVEGRLGTREESDLPAQVELDLIRAKKKQLALHKATVLPPIDELEHPFPLPHGWAWARWAEISDWITYGFTRPMAHLEAGIPIATAKHVLDGRLDLSDSHKTDDDSFAALSEKDRPVPGDILLTKDGSIGRAAIVPPDQRFCINQSVAVIWLRSCHLPREYLLLAIRSPWMQRPIWAAAEGMAIKHISVVDFGKMLLPVPPLAEQRRIVAKVDELMRLCDALEAQLTTAQTTATHLLDATLDRALTGES